MHFNTILSFYCSVQYSVMLCDVVHIGIFIMYIVTSLHGTTE